MKAPKDVERAWEFLDGFDVPAMTKDRRAEWDKLIGRLTPEQFAQAVSLSRKRGPDRLHLRPSPQEFRAFVQSPRTRIERGCTECRGGWYETEAGDFGEPATVHPCRLCCPDAYEYWYAWRMKAS